MPVTRKALFASGRRAIGVIPRLSLIVGGAGVCLMTALVAAEVTARGVFNYSIPFSVEYSEYLLPIIAFWGAAYTLRRGAHVNADIFIHRLPDRSRQCFILVGYLLGLAYLIILVRYTSHTALISIKGHYLAMYPTLTPFGYVQLMLPIGLSLFALQLVIEIIRKARLLYLSYK